MVVRWHAGMSLKDFGSNTFYSAKYDDQFEHTFKTFTAIQAENLRGRFHIRPSIYWNRNMDRFELFRGASNKYPSTIIALIYTVLTSMLTLIGTLDVLPLLQNYAMKTS